MENREWESIRIKVRDSIAVGDAVKRLTNYHGAYELIYLELIPTTLPSLPRELPYCEKELGFSFSLFRSLESVLIIKKSERFSF